MLKYLRISCKCPGSPERKGRSNFLGSLCLDLPTTAHHHCKCCNTTWEHSVKDDGTVTRRPIAKQIVFTEEIAIVDIGAAGGE